MPRRALLGDRVDDRPRASCLPTLATPSEQSTTTLTAVVVGRTAAGLLVAEPQPGLEVGAAARAAARRRPPRIALGVARPGSARGSASAWSSKETTDDRVVVAEPARPARPSDAFTRPSRSCRCPCCRSGRRPASRVRAGAPRLVGRRGRSPRPAPAGCRPSASGPMPGLGADAERVVRPGPGRRSRTRSPTPRRGPTPPAGGRPAPSSVFATENEPVSTSRANVDSASSLGVDVAADAVVDEGVVLEQPGRARRRRSACRPCRSRSRTCTGRRPVDARRSSRRTARRRCRGRERWRRRRRRRPEQPARVRAPAIATEARVAVRRCELVMAVRRGRRRAGSGSRSRSRQRFATPVGSVLAGRRARAGRRPSSGRPGRSGRS